MFPAVLTIAGFFAVVLLLAFGSTWLLRLIDKATPWPPGAAEAIRLVWCTSFGQPWSTRPRVFFIRGKNLDCQDGRGWMDAWGRCVAGQTMPAARAVNVAHWEGARWSQLALHHELGHFLDKVQGRPEDPFHEGLTFQPGGPVSVAGDLLASWEAGA